MKASNVVVFKESSFSNDGSLSFFGGCLGESVEIHVSAGHPYMTEARWGQFVKMASSMMTSFTTFTMGEILASLANHDDFVLVVGHLQLDGCSDSSRMTYKGKRLTRKWEESIANCLSNLT